MAGKTKKKKAKLKTKFEFFAQKNMIGDFLKNDNFLIFRAEKLGDDGIFLKLRFFCEFNELIGQFFNELN